MPDKDINNEPDPIDEESGEQEPDEQPDSFPRAYVEALRAENAEQRVKAKRADDLLAYAARIAVERYTAQPPRRPPLQYDDSMADDDGLPDGTKIEGSCPRPRRGTPLSRQAREMS